MKLIDALCENLENEEDRLTRKAMRFYEMFKKGKSKCVIRTKEHEVAGSLGLQNVEMNLDYILSNPRIDIEAHARNRENAMSIRTDIEVFVPVKSFVWIKLSGVKELFRKHKIDLNFTNVMHFTYVNPETNNDVTQ